MRTVILLLGLVVILASCGEEPRFWAGVCQNGAEAQGERAGVESFCERRGGVQSIRPIYEAEARAIERNERNERAVGGNVPTPFSAEPDPYKLVFAMGQGRPRETVFPTEAACQQALQRERAAMRQRGTEAPEGDAQVTVTLFCTRISQLPRGAR